MGWWHLRVPPGMGRAGGKCRRDLVRVGRDSSDASCFALSSTLAVYRELSRDWGTIPTATHGRVFDLDSLYS